jgi:hypothetical protein
MYIDTTASRAEQHRAAMEKHAQAARQAKIARSCASTGRKAAAEKAAPTVRHGWLTVFTHKPRPVGRALPV